MFENGFRGISRVVCFAAIAIALTGGMFATQPGDLGPAVRSEQPDAAKKPLAYAIAFDRDLFAVFLGVVELGTGIFEPTAVMEVPLAGLGRHQGKVYGLDIDGYFWNVNFANGRMIPIGHSGITGPAPGGFVIDIFAGMGDGRLFALDFSNNLYQVDPETGAATLVGWTGLPEITHEFWASGLAGDCESLYFSIMERDDDLNIIRPPALYRINPETAVAYYIGPTAEGIVGAAFVDGTLYGFGADMTFIGGPPSRILAVDTTSGEATLVSNPNVSALWGAVNHDGARVGHCK